MPIEMTMPRLSDTMQQGTIVKWNVKEGQKVASGDVIADIETDKATMELQTFDEGTVAALTTPEGQSVPVGTLIAVLATEGENVADVKAKAGSGGAKKQKAESSSDDNASDSGSTSTATAEKSEKPEEAEPAHASNGHANHGGDSSGNRIFASPLARKIAADEGIDLAELKGSGPGGRIVRKDVEAAVSGGGAKQGKAPAPTESGRAASAPAPAPLPPAGAVLEARTVTLSNMRRVIAERLVESKTTIPHYQVTVEVDMDALLSLRADLNEQLADQGVKLSVNDFLVRACALGMHKHPFVNSRWAMKGKDATIEIVGDVNIGVAVALPEDRGGGLVVATIRNADRIGLRQISADTKRLADKARSKGLTPQEMSDSTFTISNLGMFGVDHFTAIINPPNAAILAVGGAIQKPVVKNSQIVVGNVMSMTMSSDHRIIDGAMAAQYLQTVKSLLEKPATLLV